MYNQGHVERGLSFIYLYLRPVKSGRRGEPVSGVRNPELELNASGRYSLLAASQTCCL